MKKNEVTKDMMTTKEGSVKRRGGAFLYYAVAFLVPVVLMLVHMVLKNCYPFGDNSMLVGDFDAQIVPFYKELYSKISHGESLLYSFRSGMGYDFYSVFFYYLASPFTWIVMLFGKHIELGVTLIFLLQTGGCGVTALYYFRHTRRNTFENNVYREFLCVLFAVAYVLCAFIVTYKYLVMWLISLMLVPVVMLGIEKLVYQKDWRLYIISLILTFITNFYFSWFVCIFAVVWFIDTNRGDVKRWIKNFLKFAGCSILAALCAAAVLVPCFLLVTQREDDWIGISTYGVDYMGNIGDFIQGFLWYYKVDDSGSHLFTHNNYCGIFALLLCVLYMFNNKIPVGKRIKRLIEIILVAFSMNWVVTIYVLHGFTIPHVFLNRYAFVLVLLMLVSAFEMLCNPETLRFRHIGAGALVMTVCFAIIFIKNEEVQNLECYFGSILIFMYLILCFVLYRKKSIKITSLYVNILIIGFAELVSNAYFITSSQVKTDQKEKVISAENWSNAYEQLCSEPLDRKTSWINETNCFTYSDTNIYSSCINSDMLWNFADMGLAYQKNGGSYGYKGSTPVTALLYNVRAVLTNQKVYFGGYHEVSSGKLKYNPYSMSEREPLQEDIMNYYIMESDYDSAVGYVLPNSVARWDTKNENSIEAQNVLAKEIMGTGRIFEKTEFEDFTVKSYVCNIMEQKGSSYYYKKFAYLSDGVSSIAFEAVIPETMHLYVNIRDSKNSIIPIVYIDEKNVLDGAVCTYYASETTLDLGELKKGQRIKINVANYSADPAAEGETFIDFYQYDKNSMDAFAAEINRYPFEITSFQDTRIKGNVNSEDGGTLYLSIPNSKGFAAYVDGEKTDIMKVAGAMIGISVSGGTHTVVLKYFPYGLKTGLILSVVGFCILGVAAAYRRKQKKEA